MTWAGLTQQDFAARLKVSPASLSSVFSGRTRPTQLHVSSIHSAFPQINVSWLLFGEGEMLTAPTSSTQTPGGLFDSESVSPVASDTEKQPHRTSRKAQADTTAVNSVPRNEQSQTSIGAPAGITKSFDNPDRKVTEIRIFYDNGTYESFFPPSKK